MKNKQLKKFKSIWLPRREKRLLSRILIHLRIHQSNRQQRKDEILLLPPPSLQRPMINHRPLPAWMILLIHTKMTLHQKKLKTSRKFKHPAVEKSEDKLESNEEETAAEEEQTSDAPKEALVDWVPDDDADQNDVEDYEDDEDDNRALPLPTALESSFKGAKTRGSTSDADSASLSSGVSGSSRASSSAGRKIESARKKKSSTWGNNPATEAVQASDESVCSTDSAKFRALLGQDDTNDSALLFNKKDSSVQRDEASTSTGSDAPETDVSMTSCSSKQLQSLLTTTGSKDSAEDDGEDLLLSDAEKKTAAAILSNDSETDSPVPTKSQDIMRSTTTTS